MHRVLALVEELRPLHLSIVGGDPLVRYRELDVLLPQLSAKGIHTQVVTSAFREIPAHWASIPRVYIVSPSWALLITSDHVISMDEISV